MLLAWQNKGLPPSRITMAPHWFVTQSLEGNIYLESFLFSPPEKGNKGTDGTFSDMFSPQGANKNRKNREH